ALNILLAPVALSMAGFTAAGITAGSMAAGMMSSAAITSGGGVAAGSLVALLQSADARMNLYDITGLGTPVLCVIPIHLLLL
uniref:Uncharacterized protein n=1 Tax=Sinocyclocheilus anshuiensis TaxID=1608454 RepID=A0A671MLM1_9TELE